jgi:hypothetical protein
MNLEGSIIVVADLGELKAYRVVKSTGIDPHETMQVSHVNRMEGEKNRLNVELLCDLEYVDPHTHISDDMSDKPGRFDVSTGDPHNMKLEKERRGLKQIAGDINDLIAKETPESWCLAFPKETNQQLSELLDPPVKQKLAKNLPSDLTKVHRDQLLSHFS